MKNIENNILDISHNYYKYLLNLQNVSGIGIGYKEINGIRTEEICVNVFVDDKINEKHLTSNNIVPKQYMGIKTDVIKIGQLKKNVYLPEKFRPLLGGVSVSAGDIPNPGTLGCIVTKKFSLKSEYFILSNNHVLADSNQLPVGTGIFQPGRGFGGNIITDLVGFLYNFVPIKLSDKNNDLINYVDCAIAKVTNKSLVSKEIHSIGKIKGTSKPTLGLNIKKVGCVTGLSNGVVSSTGVTYKFELGKKFEVYQDQILANLFSSGGDSGSIILDDDNNAVGLLMGGSDDNLTTIFNDISLVLKELKIKIYN